LRSPRNVPLNLSIGVRLTVRRKSRAAVAELRPSARACRFRAPRTRRGKYGPWCWWL
jgi:hypothetical protein